MREARGRDSLRTGADGETIGAAVTRILVSFLSEEVVKRAVKELSKAIARLSAGRSPELIRFADLRVYLLFCASGSSLCRSRSSMSKTRVWKPSSRPIQRRLSPSFARGLSCLPRSRPERSR